MMVVMRNLGCDEELFPAHRSKVGEMGLEMPVHASALQSYLGGSAYFCVSTQRP